MKMTFGEFFEKYSKLDTHFLNRISALEVTVYKYTKICLSKKLEYFIGNYY